MIQIPRSNLRFVCLWISVFTSFRGAAFFLIYVLELLCMCLTSARVRGLEEAPFLLWVRSLDLNQAHPPMNELLFDFAAWFFDFNKIIAYGLFVVITFFLAEALLNRKNIDGVEKEDDKQIEKMRQLGPFSPWFWFIPAAILTWRLGGAAFKPVEYGSTSIWVALCYGDFFLGLYRVIYPVLLLGCFCFLFAVLELLVRARFHNKKVVQKDARIQLGGSASRFLGLLVVWFLALLSLRPFTGPGTGDLIARALPQLLAGAVIILLVTFVLPEKGPSGQAAKRRLPWAAAVMLLLPFIAGVQSAFIGGNLVVKNEQVFPSEKEVDLLHKLEPYVKRVVRQSTPATGIPHTSSMLSTVIDDLKVALRDVPGGAPLFEKLLAWFFHLDASSSQAADSPISADMAGRAPH